MSIRSRKFRFNLGRAYNWPLYRCLAAFLWGGKRLISNGRPRNAVDAFMDRFPGKGVKIP